ncbi:Uncharacterized protein FKW44_018295, partial [Caligus rogercresseyi]
MDDRACGGNKLGQRVKDVRCARRKIKKCLGGWQVILGRQCIFLGEKEEEGVEEGAGAAPRSHFSVSSLRVPVRCCVSVCECHRDLLGVEPPGGSTLDGKEAALLSWQHGHYMGHESGFHSGTGTENPSIVSGHESELLDPSLSDVLSTHGSMYSEGGASSVQGSFFSSLSERGAHPGSSSSQAQPAGASSSSERMEEFIPTLTKILKDEDAVVVREALANIDKGSKKEYFLRAIMSNPEIVCSISSALSGDESSVKSASNILRNMSLHKMGRASITRDPEAIPLLVRLLGSSVDRVLFCGITILHNLLIHQEEGAKRIMKEAGVLPKMTYLLKRDNAKLLTIVTDCLRILAYGNQQSKLAILEAQ